MVSEDWIDALGVDELPHDDVAGVEIAGHDVAIYSVDGRVYATDNSCTHGQARLCDGFLEGYTIECPLHQGKFDVRDGTPLCAPVTEPLRTYEARIDGSRVYVRVARN
ncbi:MAG TPA: non-heme iron oxygenase ferredoxin subunit [Vicinamibacterales bacterium]|nr:non-heme iron oxygenase ferredoxin subunit [Vicinamibacterales bacterium]